MADATSKFQKIHSDLIIEGANRKFVNQSEKDRIANSLQAPNNLSDLTDTDEAIRNLGLEALFDFSVVNERLPIVDGKFTLSNLPVSNALILNMCYVVTPNNLIIAEEYDGVYIDGLNCEFKVPDAEYEGNECLVSYIMR